jgi:hypothetical protein
MSIVNRRNALIGWATWSVVKRAAAMKAKRAVPAPPERNGSSKGKKAVKVGAILATAAGAAMVWKAKHRDSTDHDSVASEELGGPDA